MLWGHGLHPIHTSTSQVAEEDNGPWARRRLLRNGAPFPGAPASDFPSTVAAPPRRLGSGPSRMEAPHRRIARRGRLEGRTGRELAGQAGAARPLDPAGSLHHPGLPRRSRLGGVGPSAAPSSWGSGRGAGPPGTEPCHPPTPVPKPAQCTWVTPANRALPLVTMTTSERPSWQELEAPSICDQLPNPHSFPGRKEVAAGHLATAPLLSLSALRLSPLGRGGQWRWNRGWGHQREEPSVPQKGTLAVQGPAWGREH